MADRILKGAKIADVHVEQVANPAKINNKTTADTLGITIPDSLLSTFTIVG